MSLVTIGSICSFFKGASIPRARMSNSGDYLYLHYGDLYKGHDTYINVNNPQSDIPYISAVEKLKEEQFVEDGDIIYILTSETIEDLGKALMVINPDKKEVVSGTETTIMKIIDKQSVEPRWLNYLLQTNYFKQLLRQYVTGMKVFRVHPRDISKIVIELPPINVQRKIVEILDSINSLIQMNLKLNDYLAELLDTEFSNLILHKSSNWASASLLDIANYKNGLAMQKFRPMGNDPGLPVVKIRELGQGYCGSDAERCRSDIDESARIHDGDLVFSWSGTLLLDFWADGDAGLNQHLFKVTSDRYPSWLYYSWTKRHMKYFVSMAKDRATTMGHIKRSALQYSEVFIPRHDEMQILSTRMQPLVNELINCKVELRKLAKYRDALLPKLMSGEIDVSRVELPT